MTISVGTISIGTISRGGISEGRYPASYIAYYPFASDFEDKVSGTLTASFDNEPSFGGGGINTVANTNISVTTFFNASYWIDSPSDNEGANPCVFGEFNDINYVNGVSSGLGTVTFFANDGGAVGKYDGVVLSASMIGSLFSLNGSVLGVTGVHSAIELDVEVLEGSFIDFENLQDVTWDFTSSDYFTGSLVADSLVVKTLRDDAGDDLTWLNSLQDPALWDTSGDFRFGYIGIGSTVADVTAQVLLQTGNMGITTGIGITFAEIGASISSLAVDSDAIIGECFIKYVGGMLSIVIDGVESAPVASVAPAIGAFAQIGANISNLLPAPGTYGGLLFEVL